MTSQIMGKILIVDDQKNWRKALSELLDDYEISLATNVNEAKQALQEFTFDVAVLDVRLVDQDEFNADGIDLLKMLKKGELHIGVIVLTGYPESIREEILEKYSPDELIFKVPTGTKFDLINFRKKVEELVAKYRDL
jgi:DNA-binding NtrC family response regulator